jgi:HD superfamily phosphohydrolase
MISPRGKVFRDPVHGLIRIEPDDEFILDLINLPEFQRLRRVRQLGISSLTYPGAQHTRFAHSLGVYHFAKRILSSLRRRYATEKELIAVLDSQRRNVLAAALLHDVGHGPFSHMIERAFDEFDDHEEKTVSLIRDGGNITDCLAKHGIDPKSVANLILKTSEFSFLVDIISSQLDADRMDYILRDALNTGVKYGAFDAEWVLNSLCLGGEPGQKITGDFKSLRLCLEDRRGLFSAEQLVMARMHMSYQVYYHRATRGWEAHLLCLLQLAAEILKKGDLPANTPPNVIYFLKPAADNAKSKEPLTGDAWLWFDESSVEAALHAWASAQETQPELAELSRNFLLRKKTFDCIELGQFGADIIENTLKILSELKKGERENMDWWWDDAKFTSYKDFDSGYRANTKKKDNAAVSTSAILISDGELTSAAQPAEMSSIVLSVLGEKPQGTNTSLSRIYYQKNISEKIEKVLVSLGLKMA